MQNNSNTLYFCLWGSIMKNRWQKLCEVISWRVFQNLIILTRKFKKKWNIKGLTLRMGCENRFSVNPFLILKQKVCPGSLVVWPKNRVSGLKNFMSTKAICLKRSNSVVFCGHSPWHSLYQNNFVLTKFSSLSTPTKIVFFRLIRLSVLLSLSELKEKRIWLGISRQERVYDNFVLFLQNIELTEYTIYDVSIQNSRSGFLGVYLKAFWTDQFIFFKNYNLFFYYCSLPCAHVGVPPQVELSALFQEWSLLDEDGKFFFFASRGRGIASLTLCQVTFQCNWKVRFYKNASLGFIHRNLHGNAYSNLHKRRYK